MKRIWILLLCSLTIATQAQVVTITVNGNRNQQVIVNNITYNIDNSTANNFSKNIRLNNLKPGEYSLQLIRINDNNPNDDNISSKDDISLIKTTSNFTVREGYDVAIVIAPNGLIQVKDKLIAGTTSAPGTVMTDADFFTLLNNIQDSWRNTRRITAAQAALTNNNNYFTTQQAMQIIQSVTGDDNRLALAKLAYNRIIDPGNFIQIYNLMPHDDQNELATFLRQSGVNVVLSYSETYTPAMDNIDFDMLIENLKKNTDATLRMNAISQLFANETNYFTVAQVRRLVELVEFESRRLQLLENAYTHVIDPNNYLLLYNLLSTDDARTELSTFVTTATKNGGLINYNLNKPSMSDADFNTLLNSAREHLQKGTINTFLTDTFGDITNYFSSAQIAQLIGLIDGELNRLSLAKTAYRTVTDPGNYLTLIDGLLSSTLSRNELNDYVYSYRGLN